MAEKPEPVVKWIMGIVAALIVAGVGACIGGLVSIKVEVASMAAEVRGLRDQMSMSATDRYTGSQASADRAAIQLQLGNLSSQMADHARLIAELASRVSISERNQAVLFERLPGSNP